MSIIKAEKNILKNVWEFKRKSRICDSRSYAHNYRQMTVLTKKYYVYNTELQYYVNYVLKMFITWAPDPNERRPFRLTVRVLGPTRAICLQPLSVEFHRRRLLRSQRRYRAST